MKKIKLQNLVIDPTIQVREVCSQTVSKYRQAYRAGAQFPPIVVDKKTLRVVCGNHRYFMLKGLIEPSDLVDCEVIDFKSEQDLLKYAARDNSVHGRPLSTFDKKRIILRLKKLKTTDAELSKILGIPEKRISQLAGMTVCVVGGKGKKKYKREEPLKRGLEHLKGREVTEDQYQEHKHKDRGIQASSMAKALTRWIDNGWISGDEITMAAMTDLYASLGVFLDGKKLKVK